MSIASEIKKVDFRLGEERVPFYIGHDALGPLLARLKAQFEDEGFDYLFLGYDTNTHQHCAPRLEAALQEASIPFKRCVIGVEEESKTVSTLDFVLETFLKQGGSRRTVVVPVGGGIVSNTYGLVAGLLFRGIRLVQIPTTFLNAHDAVTSKKQAVNHAGYKNIVGLFHTPSLVLVDTAFFGTLGESELKSGLGELTKNAALFGGSHYELMQRTVLRNGWRLSEAELAEAVYSGIAAKDMLLAEDPKEKGLALLFEYGHTVGHALELVDGVSTTHGEGVALGMLAASQVAHAMGIMSDAKRDEHDALVRALEPAIVLPDRDIMAEVMDKVLHDNKRGYTPEREGFVPMILSKGVGDIHRPDHNEKYLEYCPQPIVEAAVRSLLSEFGPYDYSAGAAYTRPDGTKPVRLYDGPPTAWSRTELEDYAAEGLAAAEAEAWPAEADRNQIADWATVAMAKAAGSQRGAKPKL